MSQKERVSTLGSGWGSPFLPQVPVKWRSMNYVFLVKVEKQVTVIINYIKRNIGDCLGSNAYIHWRQKQDSSFIHIYNLKIYIYIILRIKIYKSLNF